MARLSIRELTLRIGARTLCERLTVDFEPGSVWAILGANGAGKTTLLHTLAGLRAPQGGALSLDDADLFALPARQRARQLALLLQDYDTAMPASVLETVLSGRHPHLAPFAWEDARDLAAADAALAAAGVAHLRARQFGTLSGGERRRVELAAVLAQATPVLLLDEPTNHLDLRHQQEILALLAAHGRHPGHLAVMVLHDVNAALRACDRALLLYGDGSFAHGACDEIITTDNLERLYGCPMRELGQNGARYFVPG
jgi:iron complex transport system ATP-binding protein